jgi:hypothetical protein
MHEKYFVFSGMHVIMDNKHFKLSTTSVLSVPCKFDLSTTHTNIKFLFYLR